MGKALEVGKVSKKPARQVDQVYALIDQLTPNGERRVATPFLFIAFAASMPVAAAHKHQLREFSLSHQLPGFHKCRMIPMVKSDSHLHAAVLNSLDQRVQLRDIAGRRFLDQHMLASVSSQKR